MLHDRLLGWFDEIDGLQPSDVLVAFPDLAAAGPLRWLSTYTHFGVYEPEEGLFGSQVFGKVIYATRPDAVVR